jgi:hypothetical protein
MLFGDMPTPSSKKNVTIIEGGKKTGSLKIIPRIFVKGFLLMADANASATPAIKAINVAKPTNSVPTTMNKTQTFEEESMLGIFIICRRSTMPKPQKNRALFPSRGFCFEKMLRF